MQRLYFLIPDRETTTDIVNELNAMGLTKDHLHVLGKDWQPLEKEGVPVATLIQTSDVVNAAKRGAIVGALIGLVLGFIAHYVLIDTNIVWMALGMTLFGALFGVWASTMVGVSVKDIKVGKYDKAIKRGAMLLIIDVPDEQEDAYRKAIKRHHPEVVIEKVSAQERKQHVGEGH
ncbi:DUF1269 domain-containing protein [Halomonas sp. MCCC 1A17488]|uniref:DUF1269 domain-containing protein n=1 Tax=unclassified Halomonas TaxID=2609666 RepID=UPI0018D23789|nr:MULTISPECIES: DUF1269 domain-containing protein [unclassified Halomonas]MCE8015001.1 DUF1269 domain-containing protein [Halomonas sp. MCCC 1A17488]MCG3238334.1 DUF1269 domain-containing protein [Halomonas sp. MCCC 1A17488]QPP47915.1 DUF1269 domain-containing protein [Halomonas sp. SS10-MC5]